MSVADLYRNRGVNPLAVQWVVPNWSIGGGGVNMFTANQSNAEVNTVGINYQNCTFTRNTTTPLVGTGDFKVVATAAASSGLTTSGAMTAVTAGHMYCMQCLVNTVGLAAGRTVRLAMLWWNGASFISYVSSSIVAPTVPTRIIVMGIAPATTTQTELNMDIVNSANGETMYVDSLMVSEAV